MAGEMAPSWGEMFYRAAAIIAVLIIALDAINFLYQATQGEPMIPIAPLLVAAAIWLIGYSCRSVSIARMN